jgi:hypothetical protein
VAGSSGLIDPQCDAFDRVSFTWNGRHGAKVLLKFNCLSTDFSRIKGVKGIPLRIAAETYPLDNEHQIERTFCKTKLFRDKVRFLIQKVEGVASFNDILSSRELSEKTRMILNILKDNWKNFAVCIGYPPSFP